MKKFNKLAVKKQTSILADLNKANFHGKRLYSVKEALCITALENAEIDSATVDIEAMIAHVDSLKPVKEAAKKREAAAPIEPTFKGSNAERDSLIEVLPVGKYLISAVQNNTVLHPVFNSLVSHAADIEATLLLMPIKYTTTLESMERKTPTYAKEAQPFILKDNVFLGSRKGVRLAVTAAILPTAKMPINTANTLNNGEALTIVASPKNQLKTMIRNKGGAHRWNYTSMICSQRHYTDSRAGDEAEQTHTFGAVFVHVHEDGTIHHQELVSNEQGDIYNPLFDRDRVVGLVAGDLHCEKMNSDSLSRLHDQIEKYQPHTLVTHDSLDFTSRNGHERHSGRFLYQMGNRSVIDDLTDTINILNGLAALVPVLFVVASNHDDSLSRWLDCNHYDPNHDVINAKTYYYLKHAILEFLDDSATDEQLNCFALACEKLAGQVPELASNVIFGSLDQQSLICGVDTGTHGHIGSGGARGSANTFKKYNIPMVVGHSHSPLKDGKGLAVVGVTGALEMGYNKGGSGWDRAAALILDDTRIMLNMPYAINEAQA